jgi:hypothetical protein
MHTWIVKTMPTKPAVSKDTPSDLGPTSLSCSNVFFQCTLPVRSRHSTHQRPSHAAALRHEGHRTLTDAEHHLPCQDEASDGPEHPLWGLKAIQRIQNRVGGWGTRCCQSGMLPGSSMWAG